MILTRPLHLVVLAPRAEVVAAREQARAKTGYAGGWTVDGLVGERDATPRSGLWVDNSDQSVDQTVDEILAFVT